MAENACQNEFLALRNVGLKSNRLRREKSMAGVRIKKIKQKGTPAKRGCSFLVGLR